MWPCSVLVHACTCACGNSPLPLLHCLLWCSPKCFPLHGAIPLHPLSSRIPLLFSLDPSPPLPFPSLSPFPSLPSEPPLIKSLPGTSHRQRSSRLLPGCQAPHWSVGQSAHPSPYTTLHYTHTHTPPQALTACPPPPPLLAYAPPPSHCTRKSAILLLSLPCPCRS